MAKKKKNSKNDLERIRLSWQIIAAKFLYYEGQKYGIPASACPSDSIYDEWEERYKELCEEVGKEPTACNMVGFDESRPSCRMVKEHLIATNGKDPIIHAGKIIKIKGKDNPVQEVRKKVNVYYEVLCEVLEEVKLDEKKAKKIKIKMKKRFKP